MDRFPEVEGMRKIKEGEADIGYGVLLKRISPDGSLESLDATFTKFNSFPNDATEGIYLMTSLSENGSRVTSRYHSKYKGFRWEAYVAKNPMMKPAGAGGYHMNQERKSKKSRKNKSRKSRKSRKQRRA